MLPVSYLTIKLDEKIMESHNCLWLKCYYIVILYHSLYVVIHSHYNIQMYLQLRRSIKIVFTHRNIVSTFYLSSDAELTVTNLKVK